MKATAMILVFVVGAGVGFFVATMTGAGSLTSSAPEAGQGEQSDLGEEIARLREDTVRVETERKAIHADYLKVTAENDALQEKLAAYEALGVVLAAAEDGKAALATDDEGHFLTDRYNGVMKKVDWKAVGSSMGTMSRLIGEIVTDLANRKSPDMAKVMEIQKLNNHLLQAAVTVQTEMPGVGTNGAFSNPAFMVNAMAATLASVNMPLTTEQRKQIEVVTKDWLAADEKRLKAYDKKTWTVVKLYQEAEIKDGFFRDAFAILTPDQVKALSPELSRGRVRLDLFSSSLIYVQRVRIVPFDEPKDIVTFFVDQGLAGLKFTEEEKAQATDLVTTWLDAIPTDLVFRETNALDEQGMVQTDRVTAWAVHQVELVRRLSETIAFDESRANYAQAVGGVVVPLKSPAKSE